MLMIFSCKGGEGGRPSQYLSSKRVSAEKVEVYLNGKSYGAISEDFVSGLPQSSFRTGLSDIQSGVFLYDVLVKMGISEAKKVVLTGFGSPPVELEWIDVADKEKKVLLSITHRGTFKVVSSDPSLIRRKNWPRHIRKIELIR